MELTEQHPGDTTTALGPRLILGFTAAVGLAIAGLATATAVATSESRNSGLIGMVAFLVVATPIAVGLWTWSRGSYRRFGVLLVATGFLWSPTTLAMSSDELLYSIGRVSYWVAEPVIIAVLLSFPSGRLTTLLERGVVAAASLTIALLYLPTALLVERYPVPAVQAACNTDCPDNAFMVTDSEPASIEEWIRPAREVIIMLILLATVAVLIHRLRTASFLTRRILTPVLALAIVRTILLIVGIAVRRTPGSATVEGIQWAYSLCLPGLALAFALGILRSRLMVGEALGRLAIRLRETPGPRELRRVLAETLEDPSLEVAYWLPGAPGHWGDQAGRPLEISPDRSERSVTEVRSGGVRVGALVHDPALDENEDFVRAAGAFALASLENQRLSAQVDASLEEIRRSRARILAAADDERRRIERDLHDGAQQRLVALGIRLELAGSFMRDDPKRGAAMMRDFADEVQAALDEVRSLAHGIYPPLLAERGLGDALAAVARRAPLPTTVHCDPAARYPDEIESAVYFCCLESLQNVSKHASDATGVSIRVTPKIRFEVHDDGAGFDPAGMSSGAGFTNMRDRLAAVGGELDVRSEPGAGTRVVGTIPLAAPRASAP